MHPSPACFRTCYKRRFDAVDPNDDAKTRCAFLFVDCVLRWLPLRDDDDTPFENAALDDVALRLGRDWAPRFLDRVFAVVDARDEKAHVPNQGAGRRHNAVLNQREDASAGLLRTARGGCSRGWRLAYARHPKNASAPTR